MNRDGCRIAVIGAGFSGVMTAIHLLWRCSPGERVYLVERSGRIGPGLAYGSGHPRHLVNVRAENMSAFEDEPDHFLRWLGGLEHGAEEETGERTIAGTFVRRSVYGHYIQDLLREAITRQDGGDNLFLVADDATAVRRAGEKFELVTASGRTHTVDAVVLALGNLPTASPVLPGFVPNPWVEGALAGLRPDEAVVLLGTGLTMADSVLAMADGGFTGPIHAISRRGLLPQGHGPAPAWEGLRLTADDRRSLLSLFTAVRREVRRAAADGIGWRAVIDAARPHLQLLWSELTPADKARFLRHVRPWWEVHRHRMAPTVAATLSALRASGALKIHAGRIAAMVPENERLLVRWHPRHGGEERQVLAQRVIDCTGLATDCSRFADLLMRQLLEDGLVRPAPLRLGVDCTSYGAILDRNGHASGRLFAVGPISRGALWEIMAVPEIRTQAEQVATAVLTAARAGFADAA